MRLLKSRLSNITLSSLTIFCMSSTFAGQQMCVNCTQPLGEQSVADGTNPTYPSLGNFDAVLTSSTDFEGRRVNEVDASSPSQPNVNGCYFNGADQSYDPADVEVTNDATTYWYVNIDNGYGPDGVGFFPGSVDYIRNNSTFNPNDPTPQIQAPCGFEIWQSMYMLCSDGSAPQGNFVENNRLTFTIYSNETLSSRAGVYVTNVY